MSDLATEVLDALERLDAETAPFGLYASEEHGAPEHKPFPRLHRELQGCLKPLFKTQGCRIGYCPPKGNSLAFTRPDGARCDVTLARTSKVKVRKYGSQYRIDPTHKYPLRWASLEMDKHLSTLCSLPLDHGQDGDARSRLLVFIGFDTKPEPFAEELASLRDVWDWDSCGVEFQSRIWDDRYDRAFRVRLCSWLACVSGSGASQE